MAFTICNILTVTVKPYIETSNTTICKTVKRYAQVAKGQRRKSDWILGKTHDHSLERWANRGIKLSINSCQKEQHM